MKVSESFEVKTGARQGCLLSPFLFILAVDWLMKETTTGKRTGVQWTPWRQLEDLDFADDIVLLSHTCDQMQLKTTELENTAKSIGLRIHPGKSKVMKVKTNSTANITVEYKSLDEVDTFTYLGSGVGTTGDTEEDLKTGIGKS